LPWIGGLIAGGGSLLGGILNSNAASDAAAAQAKQAQNALNVQSAEFGITQQQLFPWLTGGTSAQYALMQALGLPVYNAQPGSSQLTIPSGIQGNSGQPTGALLTNPAQLGAGFGGAVPSAGSSSGGMGTIPGAGFGQGLGAPPAYNLPNYTESQFQASPGYQFQKQQGINAIQNAAGPTSGALSGNTLRALQTFGTGLANQDWWNWLNNQQQNYNTAYGAGNQQYWQQYQGNANQMANIYQQLLGLSSLGSSAATNQGAQGVNLAGLATSSLNNVGNALAAGQIGSTQALTGGLSSAFKSLLSPATSSPSSTTSTPFSGTVLGQLWQSLTNPNNGGGTTIGTGPYYGGQQ
jgi:hypothetical protein